MPGTEGYRFDHVLVDGEGQTRDVIVLPDRVLTNRWRADGHRLVLADLEDVIYGRARTTLGELDPRRAPAALDLTC